MSLLSTAAFATVGMVGNPAVTNKLAVAGASTLSISGSYSGVPYVFNGPALVSSPPYQLGFQAGDRIKLKGSVGTEPNHGRDLTILNPAGITIYETLTTPDANEYEFTVYRKRPCAVTTTGLDALTRLCAWSAFGNPDVAFSNLRPRWTGVGGGSSLETRGAIYLVTPRQVTAGVYLKALNSSLTFFPALTTVQMQTVFGPAEITYALAGVITSEAGLCFDAWTSGSGSVSPTVSNNAMALYESFGPLAKLDSFSMAVTWELQF